MDPNKLPVELTPYDALEIMTFLKNWPGLSRPDCAALKRAASNFEEQVCRNITEEQIEDAVSERRVHQLLGTSPQV